MPDVLGLFTLSISLFFDINSALRISVFLSTIKFFTERKESCFFVVEYFLGMFGTSLICFKCLEAVMSSGELSEGCIVLNECSVEIGNTF